MHTILVADDSITIQRAVEIVFDKEPFTVIKASSGHEAMRKAREMRPHVVLADHSMPDQSGYDLAAELRADPQTQGIPVLLLCSAASPFDAQRGQEAGVVGHLPKPFDCQSVLDRVRTLLGVEATPLGTFVAPTAPTNILGSTLPRPPSLGGFPRPPGLGSGFGAPSQLPQTSGGASQTSNAITGTPTYSAEQTSQPPAPAARALDPFGFTQAFSSHPQPGSAMAAPTGSNVNSPMTATSANPGLSSPESMSNPMGNSGWNAMPPGSALVGMSSASDESQPSPPSPSWMSNSPAAESAKSLRPGTELLEISDYDIREEETVSLDVDSSAPSIPPAQSFAHGMNQQVAAAVGAVVAAARPAIDHTTAPGAPVSQEVLTQEARAIIERIAWEVVPELAELIIREEIKRLLKSK